jgi:hypothetical protein
VGECEEEGEEEAVGTMAQKSYPQRRSKHKL